MEPAPRAHAGYEATKRVIDICGAAALLLISLPLLGVVALLIASSSGRPILFQQQRLGHHGRAFAFYKLRTMEVNAEARRAEVLHLNTTGGPAFKHPNDPRVTRLGRSLRAYSIDELPQLWNVLKGDMSLVGPRALPIEENCYEGEQANRLSVKPGLTCIWQVGGRSETTWDQWMALDLEYVRTRSLWTDLVLLMRTPAAVITKRGAS